MSALLETGGVASVSGATPFGAARAALGANLRSLVLFGSCLSEETRRPGSVPDLLALVDDLGSALEALAAPAGARRWAGMLPPTTLALRAEGRTLAKLNLVEPGVALAEVAALRDLYLAGRLGKRGELLFARSADCADECARLRARAAEVVAGLALAALPRTCALEEAVYRAVTLSYRAELRPERERRLRAHVEAHAAHYQAVYGPLLCAEAVRRGWRVSGGRLEDPRPGAARASEALALQALLWRSRLRGAARWPKQAASYAGWLPYLAGKLTRAWSA